MFLGVSYKYFCLRDIISTIDPQLPHALHLKNQPFIGCGDLNKMSPIVWGI